MSDPVFKDDDARERIDAWYETFEDKLDDPGHREVTISHGANHVLTLGESTNPPLVCVHGAMGSSAHTLLELSHLADDYYLLAPDVPGQSVRAIPERMALGDGSHGRWLIELLDALELERTDVCAVSWGALSIDTAAIDRLILLVPAGVVTGPVWKATTKVMFPLATYKMFPNEKRLRRLMDGMMTEWDDDWAHYLGDAVRSFRLDLKPPPLTKPEQLEGFDRPTLVVAAEEDLSFPGEKLLDRMEELIPHAETELIEGARHMPPTTEEFRGWMAGRIRRFLQETEHAMAAASE